MPRLPFTRLTAACAASAVLPFAALRAAGTAPAETPPPPPAPVVQLKEFVVAAQRTDVEVWPEEQQDLAPFGNEGVFGSMLAPEKPNTGTHLLQEELAALPLPQTNEFASVSGAGTPRGFTTPRLRNGLTQLGIAEQIVGGRRDLLTGFLAVLYGRTAPGGIVNLTSRRPSPKPTGQLDFLVTTRPSWFAQAESARPLWRKTLHGRAVVSASHQTGPEHFARRDEWIAATSARYAPDKRTVLLLEFEAAVTRAVPSPGLPFTRSVPGARIGAPALGLAGFNPDGPHAWGHRDSFSLSLWAERKLTPLQTLRGGAQWWSRSQAELRFATGPFVLATGRFDGTREPHFNKRRERTFGAQLEFDRVVKGRLLNQRWLAGMEGSTAAIDRVKRALPTAVRNQLPLAVRSLDPAAPDFTTPPYSADLYSRLLTLRAESADYLGLFANDRLAWGRGRYGATVGLRHDWVHSAVQDHLPGAKTPFSSTTVGKTTYHSGLVAQLARSLAAFVNASSAFQPQRRVDARTGKIQGSESTAGFETGLRWQTPSSRWLITGAVYRLLNQNITRLNPVYEDPVLDPDRTQPQLVASGQERFTGGDVAIRWSPTTTLAFDVRGGVLEAVTTASPDMPEEVGRQLPRTPKLTGSASANYSPRGSAKGWQFNAAWAWIGANTVTYASRTRELLAYGGYGVAVFNLAYRWERKAVRSTVALTARNAFDRDIARAAGRLGGQQVAEARYTVAF